MWWLILLESSSSVPTTWQVVGLCLVMCCGLVRIKEINLETLCVSLARVNIPLLVPANDLSTAKRVRLNERKLEWFATETPVRRSEDRPLAVLNVIRIWGDVVRKDLAIYERAAGEEGAATGIGSWIVGGGGM